jgi:hypothetical protein
MTTVSILPVPVSPGEWTYRAIAKDRQSDGRTAGEALDGITSQLTENESGTLVVVQFKSDHGDAEDTATLATVRLFDPRRDVWSDRFQVDAESGSIVGITAIGRATVRRLNMNSDAQRDARLSWIRLGLFP